MESRMLPGTKINNDLELFDLWVSLMGSGGFGRRSVWMVFFDADSRVVPLVRPIDDVPMEPDDTLLSNMCSAVVRGLVEPGAVTSVALLLSRPGPGSFSSSDRRWAAALSEAFGALSPWPIHLATRDRVRIFAADDLITARAK